MRPLITTYRDRGLQASALHTCLKLPTTQTITINGIVYTFGTDVFYNKTRIEDAVLSLCYAINGDPGTYGTRHLFTQPAGSIVAVAYGNKFCTIAAVPGTAANSFAVTTSDAAYFTVVTPLAGGTAAP